MLGDLQSVALGDRPEVNAQILTELPHPNPPWLPLHVAPSSTIVLLGPEAPNRTLRRPLGLKAPTARARGTRGGRGTPCGGARRRSHRTRSDRDGARIRGGHEGVQRRVIAEAEHADDDMRPSPKRPSRGDGRAGVASGDPTEDRSWSTYRTRTSATGTMRGTAIRARGSASSRKSSGPVCGIPSSSPATGTRPSSTT
jgi:hypothetical protein